MAYTRSFNDSRVKSWKADIAGVGYNSSNLYGFPGIRTGERVSDRKAKIAAGSQAGSPFATDRQSVKELENGFASLSFLDTSVTPAATRTHTFEGIYIPLESASHLPVDTVEASNEALMKILRKITASHQQMNGSTFMGELRETIGMLRRPAESLRREVDKYFLSLENRKRKVLRLPPGQRRAAWEKALSGTWLELQWGWKPAISDAQAIATTIARLLHEPPHKERIVARATRTAEDTESVLGGQPPYGYFQAMRLRERATVYEVQYVVGLSAQRKAHASGVQRLIDICGFRPEDFIPTLYEVCPWSWLVDYFTNIGDIVEAAATYLGDVKWIVRTASRRSSLTMSTTQISSKVYIESITPYFKYIGMTPSGTFGKYKSIRTAVDRTLPLTLGVPQFKFSHPGESAGKMLNMLSVLAQRRKGLQDMKNIPPKPKGPDKKFDESYAHL